MPGCNLIALLNLKTIKRMTVKFTQKMREDYVICRNLC